MGKWKKAVSLISVAALLAGSVLAGCSNSSSGTTSTATAASGSKSGAPLAVSHSTPLTLDVFDVAANYQGIQNGWFGKVLQDKLNLKLNIIAPQVAGNGKTLYQTRSASGNLGDIVLLDNADIVDCVKANLVKDVSADVWNYQYLKQFEKPLKEYNKQLGKGDDKIYAFPGEMVTTSPTTYSDILAYTSPQLPWDYYKELGSPKLNNLDDLLNVLSQMMKKHPTNPAGGKAYGITLWKDWDAGGTQMSMECVNQLTKWYGQEVNGSILLGADGSIKPLTDENGAYYKMLHFLFEANQKGLIDPDSATQNWDKAQSKMEAKSDYLFWYSWQKGFYNTNAKFNKDDGFILTPISDMKIYQPADTYYGDGRAFAVGSQVTGDKYARVMEFLNWFCSPEGADYEQPGLKDFNYKATSDGKFALIHENDDALMSNKKVPAAYGGGGYNDGTNKINLVMLGAASINPETKETYTSDFWSSTLKDQYQTKLWTEWSKKYNATNPVDYLKKNNQISILPNVNIIYQSDTTDVKLARSQCSTQICAQSWKMVFAKDEAQFDQMWSQLKTTLKGLNWDDIVKFDTTKYQKVVDARKAAVQ